MSTALVHKKANPQQHILLSTGFIVGLLLLLLNDFVLKAQFGNVLTGKLSDFAGLFVFPLFWAALLPRHKAKVFWATGLLFVCWKLPMSQPLIDLWNEVGPFHIARVVDATDLLALLVLPLAYRYQPGLPSTQHTRAWSRVLMMVAAFAFLATSYSSEIPVNQNHTFHFPLDTLKQRAFHCSKLDSVNTADAIASIGATKLLELDIPYEFCFGGFTIFFEVADTTSQEVTLHLVQLLHRCPAEETDGAKMGKALSELVQALESGN